MSSIFLQDVKKEWGSKFKSCTTKLELSFDIKVYSVYINATPRHAPPRPAPRPNTPRTYGPP